MIRTSANRACSQRTASCWLLAARSAGDASAARRSPRMSDRLAELERQIALLSAAGAGAEGGAGGGARPVAGGQRPASGDRRDNGGSDRAPTGSLDPSEPRRRRPPVLRGASRGANDRCAGYRQRQGTADLLGPDRPRAERRRRRLGDESLPGRQRERLVALPVSGRDLAAGRNAGRSSLFEFEWPVNGSLDVSQLEESTAPNDGFQLRLLEVGFSNNRYGSFFIGQGWMASDGTAEIDVSGITTPLWSGQTFAYGGMLPTADGGFVPRRPDAGASTTTTDPFDLRSVELRQRVSAWATTWTA